MIRIFVLTINTKRVIQKITETTYYYKVATVDGLEKLDECSFKYNISLEVLINHIIYFFGVG